MPVQTDPEAHQTYCTMGPGFSPGINWPRHGADKSPPSVAKVASGLSLSLRLPSVSDIGMLSGELYLCPGLLSGHLP